MSLIKVSIISMALVALFMPARAVLAEQSCAKDLYYRQLDSKAETINTGLKYWIQLRRNGKVSFVDNRTTFHSGDEIRFVLIPNTSGFVYAVLSRGTTGEKKVLLPNKYEPKGKVTAGVQTFLPARGYLQFDKNKGVETVRLAISRKPVTASALLDTNAANFVKADSMAVADQPVQTENCLLTFAPVEGKGIDLKAAGIKEKQPANEEFSKDLNYIPPQTKPISRRKPGSGRRPVKRGGRAFSPVERPGAVTVINIDPAQTLGVEISLTHK